MVGGREGGRKGGGRRKEEGERGRREGREGERGREGRRETVPQRCSTITDSECALSHEDHLLWSLVCEYTCWPFSM